MHWNWQPPDWPKFSYDNHRITQKEKKFLLGMGGALAYLKNIEAHESRQFLIEI